MGRINDCIIGLILLLFFSSCDNKNQFVKYELPEMPDLPVMRSLDMPFSSAKAEALAMDLAEQKVCNCYRTSDRSVWELCEVLSDNEMDKLIIIQSNDEVKHFMLRAYFETKNRCKLSQKLIDSLPDFDIYYDHKNGSILKINSDFTTN